MSSLITTGPQSQISPYAIYSGPRVGDEFRMYHKGSYLGDTFGTAPDSNEDMSDMLERIGRRVKKFLGLKGTPRKAADGKTGQWKGKGGRKAAAAKAAAEAQAAAPIPKQDIAASDTDPAMSGHKSRRRQRRAIAASASGSGRPTSGMVSPEEAASMGAANGAFGVIEIVDRGMGQALPSILNAAQKLAGETVQSVEIRTQITPSVVIDKPFAASGDRPQPTTQGGNPFSQFMLRTVLKPAIYVKTPAGVIANEPYGKPEDWSLPMAIGTGVTIGAAVFAGVKLGQAMFCAKPAAKNRRKALK